MDGRDTPARRRRFAEQVIAALADDSSTRAVVFHGDGQDDMRMPALEDEQADFGFGRVDSDLAELGEELSPAVRRVFQDFCWKIRECGRVTSDGTFQEVMLYLRSLPRASRRSPRLRRVFAVRMDRSEPGDPVSRRLPWAFATKGRAIAALPDLAAGVAARYGAWNRYRVVAVDGDCRIERLPRPPRGEGPHFEMESSTITLTVEAVDVPADFTAPKSAAGDWYVDDWDLVRVKNWETRRLTGAEWVARLNPRNIEAEDGRERSRLSEEAARNCDWWKIDPAHLMIREWHFVLRHRPDLIDRCPCVDDFSDLQWCLLLRRQPQFASRFLRFGEVRDSWFWSLLLRRQPQFADRCTYWDEFGLDDWGRLLRDQPQLLGKCDLAHADGHVWAGVVAACPEQAAACPWDLLDGYAWTSLLLARPEFAARCDWSKIQPTGWCELLARHPSLIEHCDVEQLSPDDWYGILLEQSVLAPHFNSWNALEEWQQVKLIQRSPVFCEQVDWDALPTSRQIDLLLLQPAFQARMDWSAVTDERDWFRLLSVHPEFGRYGNGRKGADDPVYVWNSPSGPVVVVALRRNNWISKYGGTYPCDREERVSRHARGVDRLPYGKAAEIVDGILSRNLNGGPTALALDGVWVGQDGDEGVSTFAWILKDWFATHATDIRILYLECGFFYKGQDL